jgi:pyrroloquinoline quinone biosynthesis protein D
MVKLNRSAGETLRRCDGKTSVREIIADLERVFAGAKVEADVVRFVETAYAEGWIRYESSLEGARASR